jgi:hypothetical protein
MISLTCTDLMARIAIVRKAIIITWQSWKL